MLQGLAFCSLACASTRAMQSHLPGFCSTLPATRPPESPSPAMLPVGDTGGLITGEMCVGRKHTGEWCVGRFSVTHCQSAGKVTLVEQDLAREAHLAPHRGSLPRASPAPGWRSRAPAGTWVRWAWSAFACLCGQRRHKVLAQSVISLQGGWLSPAEPRAIQTPPPP